MSPRSSAADEEFEFRREAAMARRRTAVRSVGVGFGALVAAQTSNAAVSRFAKRLLRSPERLAAYMRSHPDPVMFAAIAGPRAVSNLCGVHTVDRSAATPLEAYAAKVASAHMQLCRTDPQLAAAREARWAGQRRLLRSGFLRPAVDAASRTYGTACRALIDSADGRRAYAVPPKGWQPVGVMSGLRVPTFDRVRSAAVLEQPRVEGMPEMAARGSGRLRRIFMIARGSARAEQLLQRSRLRVPLSTAVFKFRLKRALKRGSDSTARFLQRAANNPRRAAAAIKAGLDPLVVAGAIGSSQVEKVLRGGSFEQNTPLGRLGKLLVEERARLAPGAAERADAGPSRFDADPEYQDARDQYVARAVGLGRHREGAALVGYAWRASEATVSDGRPEGFAVRDKAVDLLMAERIPGAGGGDESPFGERPYDVVPKDGPVPEPDLPSGAAPPPRDEQPSDQDPVDRDPQSARDEEPGGVPGGGPTGAPGGDPAGAPGGGAGDTPVEPPRSGPSEGSGPSAPDTPVPPEWQEFDLETGHKVVTFSADFKDFADHVSGERERLVTDALLVSSSSPPPGHYEVAGDYADKFSSVRCIPGRQDVAPSYSLVVREGVVLDEADRRAAFDLVSLASTMEQDRATYPDADPVGDWRPPLADSDEHCLSFSPEELERLRRNRPGIVQRFCDRWGGDDIDMPKMCPDGKGGFDVFGDDEVAAIRPTADGGWKIVFHPHVRLSPTGLPEGSGGPAFLVEADNERFERAETVSHQRVADVRLADVVGGRAPHETPYGADGRGFSADVDAAVRAWAKAHPDEMSKGAPQFVTREEAAASGYTVDSEARGIRASVTRLVGDPPAELASEVVLHHVGSELQRLSGSPAEAPLQSRRRDPGAASVQPADLRVAFQAATGREPAKVKGADAPALQNGQMLSELVSARMPPAEGGTDMLAVRTAVLDVADRVGLRVAFPPPSDEDRGRWAARVADSGASRQLSESVPPVSDAVVAQVAQARESRTRGQGGGRGR